MKTISTIKKERAVLITHFRIMLFAIMIIFLLPNLSKAQAINWNEELELGCKRFECGDWKNAYSHLYKIVNVLPSLGLDAHSEGMVYYMCGVCTQQMGDVNQSINYYAKGLAVSEIQMELRIQLLGFQLNNYSDLSMWSECEEIVNSMMEIYNSRKEIDLASYIMAYYVGVGKHSAVIEFEKDIPNFILPEPNGEMDQYANLIQWQNIYLGLAYSFSQLKMYPKALDYYQKSLDTITEGAKDNRAVIYSSMSRIYYELGDKASALKYQKMSLEVEE